MCSSSYSRAGRNHVPRKVGHAIFHGKDGQADFGHIHTATKLGPGNQAELKSAYNDALAQASVKI